LSAAGVFFTRWRVRLGYPLAIAVLWFAHPTPGSILLGALVGVFGLLLRARAAGYLHKQAVLTVTGPYAHTRNPLYFGSAVLTLGTAIATNYWVSALLLCGYFGLFYSIVMRREEGELRMHHGAAFEEYAKAVPLFFPRFSPAKFASASTGGYSFAQYKKNHEWQATAGFLLLLVLLLTIWHFHLH
jgi:protein-S-isoprenylcysteine O-methyltransferase Ste14